MPSFKGLEWTFDTAAATYEKFRPGYPDELYQRLFAYLPVSEASRAVEIGIGAGQATPPILRTGCEVTAVEYGEKFSAMCREKFADFSKFSVLTGKFEDVTLEENAFDLVFSATAFHWIPEEIGYPKVFSMLKSGGVFARFANHPFPNQNNPALMDAIQEAYTKYFYPFHNRKPPAALTPYTEDDAIQLAQTAQKYGFTDICHAMFYRTRTFSAQEYISLLDTYSDHIAITEPIRSKFYTMIEDAINTHGGIVEIHDTIDLQLARKP